LLPSNQRAGEKEEEDWTDKMILYYRLQTKVENPHWKKLTVIVQDT